MSGESDERRWHQVQDLFGRALELDPRERGDLFASLAVPEDVRRETEELLRAAETPGPLDDSLGDLARTLTREASDLVSGSPTVTGRRIGSWRILETLGRGGMGRVFLVERQAGDFEQIAALKLLRWELATPALVERFKNERRILAQLDHPGVARLIDGGVTDDGLPFLVMERVEGEPVDCYCVDRSLDLGARLELFLQVCDAVQYAHRRLIVHRDLKPSNVLVTARAQVKLLDFGVGKFLEATGPTELTATHLAPATPGYAAPEQLTGGQVTTATDVYALGVLLYELLTGERPRDVGSSSSARVARGVSDAAPDPPSTKVDRPLATKLAGDLDNITLTALRHEPDRRYASVDRLAADVRRYLDGKPVDATPETFGYRFGKLVRRHRVACAAAALALLAILLGATATAWQARKARRQAARATRVADFLSSLFSSANPYNRENRAHTLEDVLRAAAERLDSELLDQPEVRGALLTQIGIGHYRLLRQDERAWEILSEAERALEPGGESEALAEIRLEKALLASERGEYEAQRELAGRAKAFFAATDGPGSEGVARALMTEAVAWRYQGMTEEADRLGREALAMLEARAKLSPLLIAESLSLLGDNAEAGRRHKEAIALKLRALELFEAAGGRHDPDVIAVHESIGISYHALGRYAEAERSYRLAIERHEQLFGPDHPGALNQLTDLARLLLDQGRFDEALTYATRAVRASNGFSESDFERIGARINLATAELETGAVAAAEAGYRAALARFVDALGEDHPAVARCRSLLADTARLRGRTAEAEELYRLALHPENRRLDEAWLGLARVVGDSGRPAEARDLLERALDRRRSTLPGDHWRVTEVEGELARLDGAAGGSAQARAALQRAVAALAESLSADNWRFARLRG